MNRFDGIEPATLLLVTILVLSVSLCAVGDTQTPQSVGLTQWPKPAVVFHVSTDGSDSAPGTQKQPFATLERARDALRKLKHKDKLTQGGATVFIHGGNYRVTHTFTLMAEDSAEASAPIRYRAIDGEIPIFSGGIRLKRFQPVSDAATLARLPEDSRDKIVQFDLASHGVTELKPLRLGGFASGLGFKTHPAMELFFNGKAMPVSRWPNDSFVRVSDVSLKEGSSFHGHNITRTGRIIYKGDRPTLWKDEHDILLYGYWFHDWADSYERVVSIDTEKREITLEKPYCRYGYRQGAPYYAVNLLCEIDTPGEWYLDRTNGMLYFYPPSDPSDAVVELSVAKHPLIKLENVSYTTFQGLIWELGAADAVLIHGGSNCLVAGCTIRHCGGNGIVVSGGASHGLLSCDIYSMGRGGAIVSGGDRKTLTHGNHFIENCDIHELSRIDHTYTPAILLGGVGNRISNNLLHDIPSSAIRLGGNDHIAEFNEIHHVVLESDDQGGADMWGNATYRGNIYRYNYWHHVGKPTNPESTSCGQAAIRLDDAISGTNIYGNVFHRSPNGWNGFGAVQIHGGKDNEIENNVFIDCTAAVSLTPWGDTRWKKFATGAMTADDIDPSLYIKRYPALERLTEDHDVNHVSRNLVLNCEKLIQRPNEQTIVQENIVRNIDSRILQTTDGGIALPALRPLMNRHGLAPIPFSDIGLYQSELRPSKKRQGNLDNPRQVCRGY